MKRLSLSPAVTELIKEFPDAKVVHDVRKLSYEDFELQKAKQESSQSDGGVIGVVWISENEVAVVERTGMHAGAALPGGQVELNEGFLEAFIREMREELGVELVHESIRLTFVEDRSFISPSGEELSLALAVFEGSMAPGQKIKQTSFANTEDLIIKTANIDNLPEIMIFGDREKLQSAIAAKR